MIPPSSYRVTDVFCLPFLFLAEIKQVRLDEGIEIAYADEGQGPETIVFLHGLGSYAPAWIKNVSVLKEKYRCIAVDFPGFGKSSKGAYSGKMSFFSEKVVLSTVVRYT